MTLINKQLKNVPKMPGFATENAKPQQLVKLLCRTFITSDEPDFYTFIEGITRAYLNKTGFMEPFISSFLILHHEDLSVDVYINDLPLAIEFLSKRSVKKGESVFESDIADIRRLRFQNIEIKNTDHIIFGFKHGWRFGLFFDFTYDGKSENKLKMDKLFLDLGYYYKQLTHHYLYQVVKNSNQFSEMKNDGWFPYVELFGSDYKELSKAYLNKFNYPDILNKLLNSFKKERIAKIVSKWWKNSLYLKKQKLIQAGVNAYLDDTDEGFINCIKNLYSEIEGMLGYLIFEDTKSPSIKSDELLRHLKEKGLKRTGSKDPLIFPEFFSTFLQNYLFPQFDLVKNNIGLSRHTSGHGLAKAEAYTRIRALQAILILDQIFFYLPPKK